MPSLARQPKHSKRKFQGGIVDGARDKKATQKRRKLPRLATRIFGGYRGRQGLARIASRASSVSGLSSSQPAVEIDTPRSMLSMVGMCGVVVMDMASGRELVLMRVQRCRRHGVGFVMVGWTVLDRPLDSDVDL